MDKKLTFKEFAIVVLIANQRPMTAREIWRYGKNHGLDKVLKKTPAVTPVQSFYTVLSNYRGIVHGIKQTMDTPRTFIFDESTYRPKFERTYTQLLEYAQQISGQSLFDDDLGEEQNRIYYAAVPKNNIPLKKDKILKNSSGILTIERNPARAKKVLHDSNYSCLHSKSHTTFKSRQGYPYMEGHHLIPCTVKNSKEIGEKYNSPIDREENIVCLCPTCHRAVHFGDNTTKIAILTDLFNKQVHKLNSIGITISLSELLKYYI